MHAVLPQLQLHAVDRDALLAGLVLGEFEDERFEIGLRGGNFDLAAGRILEGENDMVIRILALAELDLVRGEGKIDRGRTEEERRSAESKLIDFQRGRCFA